MFVQSIMFGTLSTVVCTTCHHLSSLSCALSQPHDFPILGAESIGCPCLHFTQCQNYFCLPHRHTYRQPDSQTESADCWERFFLQVRRRFFLQNIFLLLFSFTRPFLLPSSCLSTLASFPVASLTKTDLGGCSSLFTG